MSAFLCWKKDVETIEDAECFEAVDAAEAAEMWAEHSDKSSAEYGVIGGGEVVVTVSQRGFRARTFRVGGELVESYVAREVP